MFSWPATKFRGGEASCEQLWPGVKLSRWLVLVYDIIAFQRRLAGLRKRPNNQTGWRGNFTASERGKRLGSRKASFVALHEA